MAWRPHEQLIEGELDNTVPHKVTGWLKFVGMTQVVKWTLSETFTATSGGRRFTSAIPVQPPRPGNGPT